MSSSTSAEEREINRLFKIFGMERKGFIPEANHSSIVYGLETDSSGDHKMMKNGYFHLSRQEPESSFGANHMEDSEERAKCPTVFDGAHDPKIKASVATDVTLPPDTASISDKGGTGKTKEGLDFCDDGKEPRKEDPEAFDQLLDGVGLGLWQVPVIMANYLMVFYSAPNLIGSTFQNAPTGFVCSASGLPSNNSWNLSEPEDYDSLCPAVEVKDLYDVRNTVDDKDLQTVSDYNETLCHFDTSVFTSTFTSEYKLVCDRQYLAPLFQVLLTAGSVVGDFVGGMIADRFGRRSAFCAGAVTASLASLVLFLNHNIIVNLVCRFLIGLAIMGGGGPIFTGTMEIVPRKLRSIVGVLFGTPYAVGVLLIGFVSYAVRDWRSVQGIITVPAFAMVILVLFMDESPRWLAQRGRTSEALEILGRAARRNRADIPSEENLKKILETMREESDDNSQTSPDSASFLLTVMSSPKLIVISIVAPTMWFLQGIVWLGIPLNANNVSSSPFVYVILTGVMEMSSSFLGALLTAKCGRVPVLMAVFFGSGTFSLLALTVPPHLFWLKISLVMLAMLMVACAYLINYTYAPELYPTCIRGRGAAMCACIGHSSYIIVPYITRILGSVNNILPTLIFGLCGVLASILLLLLPETHDTALCETAKQIEDRPTYYHSLLAKCKRRQ
ncbi:organic cation transporter protein-like [Oratosquilla oratoria]|uniref:organic cation transporter protein-like n=1 Tax=Oratosquilla oratoria TaxID=337810 RepID=UPI003F76C10F